MTLVRLFLSLIVLTTLVSYPTIQMQILLIFSWAQQSLLLIYQPYDSISLNLLSFFNELSVSIYLYLILSLSDYLDSQFLSHDTNGDSFKARTQLSWALTLLICTVILLNCLYVITMKMNDISRYIYRRRKNVDLQVQSKKVVTIKPLWLPVKDFEESKVIDK